MKTTCYLFILIGCISCSQGNKGEKESTSTSSPSSDTITVTSYASRFEQLTYPVKAIGKIRSARRSNLIFERSGILEAVSVQNGDRVKEGQVIATLKNNDELFKKQQAEIALKKAQVDYENEMLALGDSAYYKENWHKVIETVQLKTGVLSSEVQLKQAKLAYQQTIIPAPISGIIEGIDLQPGDFVSTSLTLGSIYDPSRFEVVCDILEYDILKIKKGMEATMTPLANADTELKGTVSEINPAVDEKGLARVIIRLRNAEAIIPGLSVRVEINVTDEPSIVIPLQAVVKRSERHVVFNIDNGLAKWNYVTLGEDNGEKVQIMEGLKEDMLIITSNNLQLAHDSPVRLE